MPPALWAVAASTAMLVVVLAVVFFSESAWRALKRFGPAPPTPLGPPIERLALDLQRLRTATLSISPGTSQVRRVATLAAYDDTLVQACRALGLPDTLSAIRPGPDREAERLQVESMLEAAGLRFTSQR